MKVFYICYGEYRGKRTVRHFMRYVMAKYVEYRQDQAYRIYISDSLYYMADNKRLTKRYAEILKPQKVDNRTGDEIALDVINRLQLKVDKDA